jgi:hypothetical protein
MDGRGCYAAAFNLSDEARAVSISPDEIGRGFTKATELWTGEAAQTLSATLPPHDAAVWKIEY